MVTTSEELPIISKDAIEENPGSCEADNMETCTGNEDTGVCEATKNSDNNFSNNDPILESIYFDTVAGHHPSATVMNDDDDTKKCSNTIVFSASYFSKVDGRQKYLCTLCNKTVTQHIRRHFDKVHNQDTCLECELCGNESPLFRTEFQLARHQRVLHKVQVQPCHKCPLCGRAFSDEKKLAKHNAIHEYLPCPECDKPVKSSGMAVHLEQFHAQTILCPKCDKTFPNGRQFRAHYKFHIPRRDWTYHCPKCRRLFISKSDLDVHKRKSHPATRHHCPDCGTSFPDLNRLERHSTIHMSDKPYACEYCGLGFRVKVAWQTHTRSHTGEKPYPCQYCARSFNTFQLRTYHERTHTHEKPFGCPKCSMAFITGQQLQSHLGRRHGVQVKMRDIKYMLPAENREAGIEKPFRCPACPKEYLSAFSLARHSNKHTDTDYPEDHTIHVSIPSDHDTRGG